MFTKNFYKLLANRINNQLQTGFTLKRMAGSDVQISSTSYAGYLSEGINFGSNANNGTPSLYNPRLYAKTSLETANNYNGGVIFGSGTASPTVDDYTMAGELFATGSVSANVERSFDDEGAYWTATYTITNTGDEDFTVGEIGLYANSNSTNVKGPFLIERTVLETPITIPAGGVGLVTYNIRLVYPTE